jgi:RNase P protein component
VITKPGLLGEATRREKVSMEVAEWAKSKEPGSSSLKLAKNKTPRDPLPRRPPTPPSQTRAIIPLPDLSALPPLKRPRKVLLLSPSKYQTTLTPKQVRFARLDFETAVPKLHQIKLSVYRSPLFTLRACPSSRLPPHPEHPFPTSKADGTSETLGALPLVRFSVISSKAAVSKYAVERNRARTRFKAAVDTVIHRGVGVGEDEDAMGMLLPGGIIFYACADGFVQVRREKLRLTG